MFRTVLAIAAAGVVLGVQFAALAPPAVAEPVDDAAGALAAASVWVHPDAGRRVDVTAVAAVIGDAPVKIAILPAGPSVGQVRVLPRQLAGRLPGNTVAVIAGRYFYAGSDVLCADQAGRAASKSIDANEEFLDADGNSDLTEALIDFATAVKAAPSCSSGPQARAAEDGSGGGVLASVATGLGAGATAVLAWIGVVRSRTRAEVSAHDAQARAAVERLGRALTDLPPDDATTARDRHDEAQVLLAAASTREQFSTAHRLAREGLAALGRTGADNGEDR
ncbi:hypothetical protein ACTG9Q_15620 [Actinokineospora sp. 24-640]